jgi:RNase H-like domain found in reverse transcriptase/Reverse transcriptase (RNA-dependent DNA polymerase)/Integrase zinc binding domain
VKINEVETTFKLDSGAQCNVMPLELLNKVRGTVKTTRNKRLVTFSKNVIDVVGDAQLCCEVNGRKYELVFKIVEGDYQPILGCKSCTELDLIRRVHEINFDELEKMYEGLGCIKGFEYDIDIDTDAQLENKPPRKIPLALHNQVRKELDSMVQMGVIKEQLEPTPISSPMVIVKKQDKLRICIDPTELNQHIRRRHFPLTTIEEIATRISGSKYFTLLDCRRGFWQIKVTPRTSKYFTFSTPWGRFSFLRLPFGVASAPEVFQQLMCNILRGCINTEPSMDDILIHANNQHDLERYTEAVLQRLNDVGLTLNREKCIFASEKLKFLGHIVSSEGLSMDPEKVAAIHQLETPKDKKQLQRLLGMVTYLGKFIKDLSQLTEKLRELTKNDVAWLWTSEHDDSVSKIKEVLASPPVLRFYDVNLDVTLSVDASSKAVGGALLQQNQPVAYYTKALNSSEQNYPQIEKEAVAIRYACKKWHPLIFGKRLIIETDHKPLEIIYKKGISKAPPRLQRILFDIAQYSPKVVYKKGTEIPMADFFRRDIQETSDIEVCMVICATPEASERMKKATTTDSDLQGVIKNIMNGWPRDLKKCDSNVRPYFGFRDELTYYEGLVFKGNSMIVPRNMVPDLLKQLHHGHFGAEKCLNRAKDVVFWLNIRKNVEEYVKKCSVCQQTQRSKPKEKMIVREQPGRPFQEVNVDLFTYLRHEYLLLVDTYSNFFDFKLLPETSSGAVIQQMKGWFSLFGIPNVVYSDNGPQFSARQFKEFGRHWQFEHRTSSPYYPRSNGLAERYVQEAKNILKRCSMDDTDVQMALLNARNIPREHLGSTNERLLGHATRTLITFNEAQLEFKKPNNVKQNLQNIKGQQKHYADRNTVNRKKLVPDTNVLVQKGPRNWIPGVIVKEADSPRSYVIRKPDGKLIRRNSQHVVQTSANVNFEREPSIHADVMARNRETDDHPDGVEENHRQLTPRNGFRGFESQPELNRLSTAQMGSEVVGDVPFTLYVTRSGRSVRPPVRLDL